MQVFLETLFSGGALAQLDIDGFLLSDTFLFTLAQLITSLILQVLNVLLFGAATVG